MKTDTVLAKWAERLTARADRLSARLRDDDARFSGVLQTSLAAAGEAQSATPPGAVAKPLSAAPAANPHQALATAGEALPSAPALPAQPAVPPPVQIPTPEQVFGGSPFVDDPRGQFVDGNTGELRTYGFRPAYFATESAARQIAEQLGGTVVERHTIVNAGYFTQLEPNRMILLPNGREVNAGLVADFYNHGYSQSYIDRLIANEINPEGGYGNLATPVTIVRNGVVQPGAIPKTESA